jgi:hypothetical protein
MSYSERSTVEQPDSERSTVEHWSENESPRSRRHMRDAYRAVEEAVIDGDLAEVVERFGRIAVGQRDKFPPDMKPLLFSARTPGMITALVKLGADINQTDYGGTTPLLHAMTDGSERALELVCRLVALGADVNGKDRAGDTPLHKAMLSMHTDAEDFIRVLLRAGANASLSNTRGETALVRAVNRVTVMRLVGSSTVPEMQENLEAYHEELRWRADRLIAGRRLAFAMGLHKRLGFGLLLNNLSDGALRMILDGVS